MAGPYVAIFLNEKNERVVKPFENPIKYRKFINRAKKSKKISLTSYDDVPN